MSPRRKGQKSAKSDKTRERIYQAAMELFRERGFDQATMRDIAGKAGVALGATYYYFRSKEEIVMRFYGELQADNRAYLDDPAVQGAKDLEEQVKKIFHHHLDQLQANRHFLSGLFRQASNPESPLSPFSQETRSFREGHIEVLRQVIAKTDMRIDSRLAEYLPKLLWLYFMGIILFWFYDRSEAQRKTRELLDHSLGLIITNIRLFNLPFIEPLRQRAFTLFDSFAAFGGQS